MGAAVVGRAFKQWLGILERWEALGTPSTLALGVWGHGDAEVAWGSVSCPLQSLPSKDTLTIFIPVMITGKCFPLSRISQPSVKCGPKAAVEKWTPF